MIRIPRDVCQFYEFWRAAELIDIGRHQVSARWTKLATERLPDRAKTMSISESLPGLVRGRRASRVG